ncbi:MAG: DUF2293 domain-containing protein [Victivallales bacterium]
MGNLENKDDKVQVFMPDKDSSCSKCGIRLDNKELLLPAAGNGVLCMKCAGLGHLVFLPSGDPALSRRSQKYSKLSAVVLKWSRRRRRYERQGLLVERDAVAKAECECLSDNEARGKRKIREAAKRVIADREYIEQFTKKIKELFPCCPKGREIEIAEHACQKYSGRIGRSSMAKELETRAVRLAVIAHIRHAETRYDELLMSGRGKKTARADIEEHLDKVLKSWERRSQDRTS